MPISESTPGSRRRFQIGGTTENACFQPRRKPVRATGSAPTPPREAPAMGRFSPAEIVRILPTISEAFCLLLQPVAAFRNSDEFPGEGGTYRWFLANRSSVLRFAPGCTTGADACFRIGTA